MLHGNRYGNVVVCCDRCLDSLVSRVSLDVIEAGCVDVFYETPKGKDPEGERGYHGVYLLLYT
jgi:hypothetical protein